MVAQAAVAAGVVGTDITIGAAQKMREAKASQTANPVYWLYEAKAIVRRFRGD